MGRLSKWDVDPDSLLIVVGFDPGGTTGYCVLGVKEEALTTTEKFLYEQIDYFDYGQIDCGTQHGQAGVGVNRGHDGLNLAGENAGIRQMVNIVDAYTKPAIVIEDFILDMKKANSGRDLLSPVRVIAGFTTLLDFCFPGDGQKIFVQNRSLAKTTCTDERLKNWSLYDRFSGVHSRDALRHSFYFLRCCRGLDYDAAFKRHLAWPDVFPDPAERKEVPKAKPKSQAGQRVTGLG